MSATYIDFVEIPQELGRKTKAFDVRQISTGHSLGHISWYGPWRQYCFWTGSAIFNKGCMNDIIAKIDELMKERRK